MESRHSLLQSGTGRSSLVGARAYEVPLLPWEKQLIRALGCTEDEYEYFRFEALKRSGLRPAGYEHIPDIQAKSAVTAFVINLIVGLTLTAVSHMLLPKPKQPKAGGRKELAGVNEAGRFTPTYGFDSAADLGVYGQTIPIIFGKAIYEDSSKQHRSGGMLVSPLLVWSRMFSLDEQQAAKQLFIISEQGHESASGRMGLLPPDLEGIFIGNGPLDVIYRQEFAFYWKPNTRGSYRLTRGLDGATNNLLYGTTATSEADALTTGDPDNPGVDDIFACPTGANNAPENAYSGAHSLSNSREFGAHSPISAGTEYKLNWRVISIPHGKDGTRIMNGERIKIAGSKFPSGSPNPHFYRGEGKTFYDRDGSKYTHIHFEGMLGCGRAYSRRMGIVSLTKTDGTKIEASEQEKFKIWGYPQGVDIDDEITFLITSGTANIPKDTLINGRVTVEDINGTVDELRETADDALKLGTIWQIGRTWWQVINRSLDHENTIWKSGVDKEQVITLKCVDNDPMPKTAEKIPIANRKKILLQGAEGYFGSFIDDIETEGAHTQWAPGPSFFPLMQSSKAVIRNNRACDITEIGFKSRVYTQLNGLCNFQTIPTPSDLHELDDEAISVSTGNVNSYILRYSFFYIKLRPIGVDPETLEEYAWDVLDLDFAVKGSRPVDQYHAIQIKHNSRRAMEYQIVPKTGAEVAGNADHKPFLVLTGNANVYKAGTGGSVPNVGERETIWGDFEVRARGTWTKKEDLLDGSTDTYNEENGPTNREFSSQAGIVPAKYDNVKPTAVETVAETPTSGGGGVLFGRAHAIRWELFGDPDDYTAGAPSESPGYQKTYELSHTKQIPGADNDKEIRLIFKAHNFRMKRTIYGDNEDNGFTKGYAGKSIADDQRNSWLRHTIEVDVSHNDTNDRWDLNEEIYLSWDITADGSGKTHNPFAQWMYDAGHRKLGITLKVSARQALSTGTRQYSAARIFEEQTHIADISAYYGHVTRSNDSAPEHRVTYINEIIENEEGQADYEGLTIAGLALKASRNYSNLDQIRFWLSGGIPVQNLHPDDNNSIGESNLLTDLFYYLLTNRTAGLGRVLNIAADDNSPKLIDKDTLIETSKFLRRNELFFNGAISEAVNLRDYMNQVAPNFLCNFIIADGRFSLKPAVPVTNEGDIDTGRVDIKQLFTGGNIIEDSFESTYLTAEQKKPFKCIVKYRLEAKNQFPMEQTLSAVIIDSSDTAYPQGHKGRVLPEETYDLTQYCTTKRHAKLVAKYLLSLRNRVTHTISFKTTPYGISLAPCDLIRVVTEFQPYSAANNGIVTTDGTLVTASTIAFNANYDVLYYRPGSDNPVTEGKLELDNNGKVKNSDIYGCVFTLLNVSAEKQNVYRVEQLTIGEDNMVEITASEFPCNDDLSSLIAQDISSDARFDFEFFNS